MAVTIHQGKAPPTLPTELEAEQAILGACLYDNDSYASLKETLRRDDFYEPLHQRIYEYVERRIGRGLLAEPIGLSDELANDKAYSALGGLKYVADLIEKAADPEDLPHLAKRLRDAALRRGLIHWGNEISRAAVSDQPEVLHKQAEAARYALSKIIEDGGHYGKFVEFSEALRGAIEAAANAFLNEIRPGLITGLPELDERIGGLQPADLVVIVAPPTAEPPITAQIAFNVAMTLRGDHEDNRSRKAASGAVALFSLEAAPEQIALNLLSTTSGVTGEKLRRGNFTAQEFAAVRDTGLDIQDVPLFIDSSIFLRTEDVLSRARILHNIHDLRLIVVDEIRGLVADGDAYAQTTGLAAALEQLSLLGRELQIPIVVGSKSIDGFPQFAGNMMPARLRNCMSFRLDDAATALVFSNVAWSDRNGEPLWAVASDHSNFRVSIPEIQEIVAEFYGVAVPDLLADKRNREIARPRQIAIYLARKLTSASLADIARYFNRDHTAILHAVRRVEAVVEEDEKQAFDISAIVARLGSMVMPA